MMEMHKIDENNRILVVEDNDAIRDRTAKTLEKHGYEVFEACNGEEGVQLAKEKLPSLILMDIIMPKLDGAAAAKQIGESPLTSEIPIIFLTDLVSSEDNFSSIGLNINSKKYFSLAKPFKLDVLTEKIFSILTR